MSEILENYSDIGLKYDISHISTYVFNVPSYGPIYLIEKSNSPNDVASMAIEAIDRSNVSLLDVRASEVVEDIRAWFTHPEDDSYSLSDSFWNQVETFIYDEQDAEMHEAQEWQHEISMMNASRQRELVEEMRGW